MIAMVRLQLLREALGASDQVSVDQLLAEVRRLRALDVRRVSHLSVCQAYSAGISAIEKHISREVMAGCSQLEASAVLRWLACIEADAHETQAYAPRGRATDDGRNVYFLPGVDPEGRSAGGPPGEG